MYIITERGRKRERERQSEEKNAKRKRQSESEESEMKEKFKIRNKQYEEKRKRLFNQAWVKFYPWVVYDQEKGHMYCSYCRKFPRLADEKSSLYIGCGSGGKFREVSLKYHSLSKAHVRCANENDKTERESGSAPLEQIVETTKLDEVTGQRMRSLFNTAFYVGRHDTFSKFEPLCNLQEKNGVNLGTMYRNYDKCKEFISCIADVENTRVEKSVIESRFFTVLANGATDSAVIEQETAFVRYVNATGIPCTEFIDIVPVKSANAEGVLDGILTGLEKVGISNDELKTKLVSCNFDGAAVMLGKKGGVAVKLEQMAEHPIIKVHCVAHNLELGFLDAVKSLEYMSHFQNTIQQIYKFYYYSPKRRMELKAVAEILDEHSVMQTGLQKTRCVASRYRSIKAIIQSMPTIVTHFQNAATGKNEEACKVKRYPKEIYSSKFLHFAYFLCDVLSVLSELSIQFQSDLLTITDVKTKIELSLLKLEKLKHKDGESYSHFKVSYNEAESVLTCGKNQSSTIDVSKSTMNFDHVFDISWTKLSNSFRTDLAH
ncbi:zinc finger protein 862-like [Pecten maximus]|uniref:zinc finger protein 862-like n=1 Tax=Pecten maximus TaxID=6579 RepID=UPI0014581E66|nr:zinc finger protein 862-like [Pecten maximus]